jgi:ferredoxin
MQRKSIEPAKQSAAAQSQREVFFMTYVIAEGCTKDGVCVDVCESDSIHTNDDAEQYFIDPDSCIDCGMCESECPTGSIFAADDLPTEWKHYADLNAKYFLN